jgi:hypothetical protein
LCEHRQIIVNRFPESAGDRPQAIAHGRERGQKFGLVQ